MILEKTLHIAEESVLDFRCKQVIMQVSGVWQFTGLVCQTKRFVWFALLWRGCYKQHDQAVQF